MDPEKPSVLHVAQDYLPKQADVLPHVKKAHTQIRRDENVLDVQEAA
jgi:hypothetical protein